MRIRDVNAREILDSRGNPTIETTVILEDGSKGSAAVPSGASTGKYEALELRDNDPSRFNGLGVLGAVRNVEGAIRENVIGIDAGEQEILDKNLIELDGTENKRNLGANAILSVSLAAAKAEAVSEKKNLYEYLSGFSPGFGGSYIMPVPMMNIINGGRHANWASDLQEYMILPVGATSMAEAIRICDEIYIGLKKIIAGEGFETEVGDEGGFAPDLNSDTLPLDLIMQAIDASGHGNKVVLGIDAAASEFYENGSYSLKKEKRVLKEEELSRFYREIVNKYPVRSIEDPFHEDDWDGFRNFFRETEGKIQIVGDDLYATNLKRLKRGAEEKTTNSILIKPNQIGTLTETINAILFAKKEGMTAVISHRSGETEDTFIADLAVAMGTGQIKSGAPGRGERIAKYNRLTRIEEELGGKSVFAEFPFK